MNISRFFIDRPIFASVLSLLVLIAGLIAIPLLPISEYPEVVPPSVVVSAQYPGANPRVLAETVAAPLEEQINGVENMLYMFSQGTSDGMVKLTITFKLGTDPDKAQQLVQNRVSQALPRLPDEVRQFGVTTIKSSPDLTMVVHLISPNERYDMLYLRNYALLNVKDQLSRINGVGQVAIFGAGDYAMRIWLDPKKLSARNLTAGDVVAALREQNVQVAAGVVGGPPYDKNVNLQLSVNAQGRLTTSEQFGDIVLKAGDKGAITQLKDVARIELGSSEYALRSLLNNKPAVAIPIFQAPGSNAIKISDTVRTTMEKLKQDFPEGVDYSIVYDPTIFVRDSITAVIHTLLEAIALVVLVVILFLQTWRASIIPLIAVPISIIGTFAVLLLLGFSINALTLFGLVLAIGIVVDDAIVVVENVERNIENGLSPKDATYKAMQEVSGPIIAIALTLIAVFVPIAFISGLTGQFYRQFALTIAISTVISAFNSLTLSPALAALLLKGHDAPKDGLTRIMDKLFGGFFRWFNRVFARSSEGYRNDLRVIIRRKWPIMIAYVGLIGLTWFQFQHVPTGFIPAQDKQYLIAFTQLPDGTTLDRTEGVIRRMSDIMLQNPGVQSAVAFPGLSINGFSNSPNAGIVFATLKPFAERKTPELAGNAIAMDLNKQLGVIQDGFVAVFPPPAVMGLGTIGGFKLQVEDRGDAGYEALYSTLQNVIDKARKTPELAGVFSGYQINVPQLAVDVDRVKAKQLGVKITDIFDAMQIYLGSSYVNDFNLFGRTYRVLVQADAPFRAHAEDISRLEVRNDKGEMVPLGSLVRVSESYGPDRATRYNAYRAAEINGGAAPGFSSGQAQAAIEKLLHENLPKGMSFEWTELTYQQILAGNTALLVFPLCVLFVFMVLAAQYESLTLPLAVILIVPMCLLCALTGVSIAGMENNIFTQIGLIVLVGLACKNAILIVEFAREMEIKEGMKPVPAVLEACRLRLRPILMTSLAFIMGVVPLITSSGAGSEMRKAMGVAVFSGMVGVTLFGLFLTPVFYVVLRKISMKLKKDNI
ncbi:MAG: efflux RND transporter permease subunit [Alphaproteobacteria bacterium]